MRTLCFVLAISILIIKTSCKKNADGTKEEQTVAVTDVGAPDGTPSSRIVGTTGGTLISSDGNMEIIIPSGAIATNTEITIQPITNKCVNGLGKAYRCTPDGLMFSKNITLKFHYTEDQLSASKPEYMGIAFQNATKSWQLLTNYTNNTSAKTISAEVNHFTDFTAFDVLDIEPPSRYLNFNESGDFKLHAAAIQPEQAVNLLGILVRSPVVWKVNGVTGGNDTYGRITPVAGTDNWLRATYKAPATAPPNNMATISAEINARFVINGQTFEKGILTANVYFNQLKFSFEIKMSGNSACNYSGQSESDAAEMDVKVQGDQVTITNITNHNPGPVLPGTISSGPTPQIQCQVTGSAGQKGFLNIGSATGVIEEDPFTDKKRLRIKVVNHESDTNNCTVTCSGITSSQTSIVVPDFELEDFFVLKDSAQTHGSQPGIQFKLIPKP